MKKDNQGGRNAYMDSTNAGNTAFPSNTNTMQSLLIDDMHGSNNHTKNNSLCKNLRSEEIKEAPYDSARS